MRALSALLAAFATVGFLVAPAGHAAAAGPARPDATGDRQAALMRASDATVGIEARAVEDARSAGTLGRDRKGSGVVIDGSGLVLTIGYLILEAERVDIVLDDGRRIPARISASCRRWRRCRWRPPPSRPTLRPPKRSR